ncbi:MAG: hydroxymethylglutaryl-CoA lyase [Gemmatimonas sp.]|nr:hydroxymethylglutaryl-CoA lyase [Gemmatimonas sp.]
MAEIIIHEVGPRDGLQVEKQVVPTDQKLAWIRSLVAAGLDIVQVGSFVHPEKVPQMADTDEIFRALDAQSRGGTILSGLVLNEKGLERGFACGVDMFCLGVSASETHSQKNTGMGSGEAQRRIIAAAREAVAAGKKVQVSVQSAFGCGFEGPIPEERVLDIVRAYLEAGLTSISLADTAGHAHPGQVRRLFGKILQLAPEIRCTCHFHDTYGLGMANIYAAMESGVTSFETSFAGLGGCPFTKVAAGNVATEDLVHALRRSGLRTEIGLEGIVAVAREVAAHFGRDMPGRVHKTGPLSY